MKREFDLIIAGLALIIFIIPMFFIGIGIYALMGFPVFFKQERTGKDGKTFTILKFRTMHTQYDEMGDLRPDEARITKLGAFLRKTSLDELPELFNILKGDMSLVGPRPLLVDYLPWYSEEQMHRHDVRPGVTGWAQVNGRNAVNWEERFKLDTWYIENQSLKLDLKILFKTVGTVIGRKNISAKGHATMPRFDEWVKQNYPVTKAPFPERFKINEPEEEEEEETKKKKRRKKIKKEEDYYG